MSRSRTRVLAAGWNAAGMRFARCGEDVAYWTRRGAMTGSHHEQDCNSANERSLDSGSFAAARDVARRAQRSSLITLQRLRDLGPRHPGGGVPLVAWGFGLRQIDGFAVAVGPHGADAWRDQLGRGLSGARFRVPGTDTDALVRRVHQRVAAFAPRRSVERELGRGSRTRLSRSVWLALPRRIRDSSQAA